MLGEVPEAVGVMWHHQKVLRDTMGLGRKVRGWKALAPDLSAYAHMAVAAHVGCSWCLDFNYFTAEHEGLRALGVVRGAAGDAGPGGGAGMNEEALARHRGLLFTVAYEMLGSAADAEDVVQETWLRWAGVDAAEVRHPRAYLVQIVTRQALNRLRSSARQREEYVGEWLPEPLLTGPDVAADVELAESVSMAMLTVLETLGPAERAVFVLREVFDTPYDEIAAAVGKSPAAVRQIAHRAREHVDARRPRMPVTPTEQQAVVERFLAAVRGGDLAELLDVLAPDVVMVSDGGGVVQAALRPISGGTRVARTLLGLQRIEGIAIAAAGLNGAPGARIELDGHLDTVVSIVVEGGRVTRIYAVRNPHKLAGLDGGAALTRR
jgi:RNA polymerase sigma-70 factor (ECF subfamily)